MRNVGLLTVAHHLRRFLTARLVSSRKASEAIQRAEGFPSARISFASRMAFLFSARFRFPIWRNAQLTAFLTKFLSSLAPRLRWGKNLPKTLSGAALSWTASVAIMTKPARRTNSRSSLHHRTALATAYRVLSNNTPQHESHTAQLSKSFAHRSI